MKTLIISFCALFFIIPSFSQNPKISELQELTENSKSGNYKDILASFFQFASKDLTGNEKSIEMNSTLFALKLKANPDINKDIYFQNERFSRNFQFNFKLNFNESYKYKGFTGGFTYAIINNRDKQLADFSNSKLQNNYIALINQINMVRNTFISNSIANNNLSEDQKKQLGNAEGLYIESLINMGKVTDDAIISKGLTRNIYNYLIDQLQVEIEKDPTIKNTVEDLNKLRKDYYDAIDVKSLWTVSIDGTTAEKGKFNKASIGTIFLQGIKEKSELDIRAKLIIADTLTINPITRIEFNSKAGINFKIAKGANNVSFFEIKGAFEYNSILKNILPTEKKDVFLGTAEIRIRLANDLWLPLIVKYDIEKANFLGFLNVSYNLGSFKSKGK